MRAKIEVTAEHRVEIAVLAGLIGQFEQRIREILSPYMKELGKAPASVRVNDAEHLLRHSPDAQSTQRGRVIISTDDGGCYEDPPGVCLECPA